MLEGYDIKCSPDYRLLTWKSATQPHLVAIIKSLNDFINSRAGLERGKEYPVSWSAALAAALAELNYATL